MKNIILSIILVNLSFFVKGQDSYEGSFRSFMSEFVAYDTLVSGETLDAEMPGSIPFNGKIDIGFVFENQYGSFDSLEVGPADVGLKNEEGQGVNLTIGYLYDASLYSNSKTRVKTELRDNPSGQIRIVEFHNLHVTGESEEEVVGYQIWLYENTNVIEYRYGENSFTSENIFMKDSVLAYMSEYKEAASGALTISGWLLRGAFDSPKAIPFDPDSEVGLSQFPSAGTVYRFGEVHTAIQEINEDVEVKLLKENTVFIINVEADNSLQAAEVYSITGKLLKEKQLTGRNSEIDFSGLANGVYLLKVKTQRGTVVKKVTR